MIPYLEKPITKKDWWSGSRGRVPAPSKHKALSSNSSTVKKKK
jgi:hypothetical protein